MTLIDQTLNPFCQRVDVTQPGLLIKIDDWAIKIDSNSRSLLDYLADYFNGLATFEHLQTSNTQSIIAVQIDHESELAPLHALPFDDWQREANKTGRKEAVFDWLNANNQPQRLIHKIKTGLVLWQSQLQRAVFGDLVRHPNQVINFILSQYLNHWQQAGWLLGHCAALQLHDHRGVAIAGVSGGGKSTLMLKLLEQAQGFISNDRILIGIQNQQLTMRGIPKQPRINPGTIIHNPKLHRLIENHQPYLSLPAERLRALEEKYDVPVTEFYPDAGYQPSAQLNQLYLLNWQADSTKPTCITPVNLAQRQDLLLGVMKSAGVFYQDAQQHFQLNGQNPDPIDYLDTLAQAQVYEITGKLDFELAADNIVKNVTS